MRRRTGCSGSGRSTAPGHDLRRPMQTQCKALYANSKANANPRRDCVSVVTREVLLVSEQGFFAVLADARVCTASCCLLLGTLKQREGFNGARGRLEPVAVRAVVASFSSVVGFVMPPNLPPKRKVPPPAARIMSYQCQQMPTRPAVTLPFRRFLGCGFAVILPYVAHSLVLLPKL